MQNLRQRGVTGKKNSGSLLGRIGLLPFSPGHRPEADALGSAGPLGRWGGHLKLSDFDAVLP
jgi:hypothetical protein